MTGAPIETDALVIGAGPVGLWQVFQLGLQDIRCHVIDALPGGGGQPAELYPGKPIYDIPGLPVCSGQELMDRLQQQVRPFAPSLHLGQTVTGLVRREDARFDVQTSAGTGFIARSVFIAAGVGAFQARPLKLEGIEAFEGSQVFHRPQDPEAFAGLQVVVHGGEEHAVDWALRLADAARPPAPRSARMSAAMRASRPAWPGRATSTCCAWSRSANSHWQVTVSARHSTRFSARRPPRRRRATRSAAAGPRARRCPSSSARRGCSAPE